MKTGDLVSDRYIVKRQIGDETFIAENLASGILWILKALGSLEQRSILPFLNFARITGAGCLI